MKKIIVFTLLLILMLACNIPQRPFFEGISPILTATAAARMADKNNPTTSENSSEDLSNPFYTIQSGDTLAALAARFQTKPENILKENLDILNKGDLTTLKPGIKITLQSPNFPENSSFNKIIPDSLFIYGPSQGDFNAASFLKQKPGWLNKYLDNSAGNSVTAAQIIQDTAENYSISPRILLALLEYQLGGISNPDIPYSFYLGSSDPARSTFGKQLSWAANTLNNGYYGWREGNQVSFSDIGNREIYLSPTLNAGTVGIQYYFSRFIEGPKFEFAISTDGFLRTYEMLFGKINLQEDQISPLIPANLQQPSLGLPFSGNIKWSYTGGPHSGWGNGNPLAAIDFAPPSDHAGCDPSPHWAVAMAEGIIARSESGTVKMDLDMDGNPHTGWVILYLHISPDGAVKKGTEINAGERIGHPSCVGGSSSGRNLHIARLYNGEWIPAGGVIPMILEGWEVTNGESEYQGQFSKGNIILRSSSQGEWFSQLSAESP